MTMQLEGNFTPDFLGDVYNDTRKSGKNPTNVADALREIDEDKWDEMSMEVFNLHGDRVDIEMVMSKIIETDTVDGLEVPVGVYIDPEGYFTVEVYDDDDVTRECAWCGRITKLGDDRVSHGMCKECEEKDKKKYESEENPSGYVQCACRDCFEETIGTENGRGESQTLCDECEQAGCSSDGDEDCQREDAYGVDQLPKTPGKPKMDNNPPIRRQKFLPKELERLMPPLGSQDGKPHSQIKVPIKYFSPYSGWTWYAYEYDPEEQMFFGLVHGIEKEFGYFSRQELEEASGMQGRLPLVERDKYWNPKTTLADVEEGRERNPRRDCGFDGRPAFGSIDLEKNPDDPMYDDMSILQHAIEEKWPKSKIIKLMGRKQYEEAKDLLLPSFRKRLAEIDPEES